MGRTGVLNAKNKNTIDYSGLGAVGTQHFLGHRIAAIGLDANRNTYLALTSILNQQLVGSFSGATAGSGVTLTSSVTKAFGVYADDGGAALGSATFARAIVGRYLLTYTSGNREQEAGGVVGQVVSSAGTNRHNMAGTWGSYEARTSLTVGGQIASTDTWCQAGVIGRVGGASITIANYGVLAGVAAMSNIASGQLTNVAGGVYAAFYAGAWAGTTDWQYGMVLEGGKFTTGISAGACTTGIEFTGLISDQVIDYTTETSVGETTDAHLIRYGTIATPIIYTPTTSGAHSGIQMYIKAANVTTGKSLAAIRTYVEFTGTAKATAYGGLFWVNLNTSNYTGDYLGGTPAGVQGVLQIEGTVESANDHAWYCGVAGEVRPLTGTVTKVGVISGLRAVMNCDASDVSSGVLVGVHVGVYSAGTIDAGVLVLPHVGCTVTAGLHLDSQHGTITTGINIGPCATGMTIGTCTTGLTIGAGCTSAFQIGASSTTAGSGVTVNATAPVGFYFDDGGAALTAWSECFTVGLVLPTASTGATQSGFPSATHIYIDQRANYTGPASSDKSMAALWAGYLVRNSSTIDGFDDGYLSAMQCSIDVDNNCTVASGTTMAGITFGGNWSLGTISGSIFPIGVSQTNGDWTGFIKFQEQGGCIQDSAAGSGGNKYLKVYLGGTLYTIIMSRA